MSKLTQNKARMTPFEAVSIFLSVLALLISGVTGYAQFGYDRDALVATVVKIDPGKKNVTATLSILNKGNRQARITSAFLTSVRRDTDGTLLHDSLGSHEGQLAPLRIAAGENELAQITATVTPELVFQNLDLPVSTSGEKELWIGLAITAVDSNGAPHELRIALTSATITKERWVRWGAVPTVFNIL